MSVDRHARLRRNLGPSGRDVCVLAQVHLQFGVAPRCRQVDVGEVKGDEVRHAASWIWCSLSCSARVFCTGKRCLKVMVKHRMTGCKDMPSLPGFCSYTGSVCTSPCRRQSTQCPPPAAVIAGQQIRRTCCGNRTTCHRRY